MRSQLLRTSPIKISLAFYYTGRPKLKIRLLTRNDNFIKVFNTRSYIIDIFQNSHFFDFVATLLGLRTAWWAWNKGILEERLRDMQFKTCALPKCKFLQNSSLKHRISFHLSKYSVGQQCWWQHFSFWGQSSWLLHSFNVRKHTPLLTCLTLKQKKE